MATWAVIGTIRHWPVENLTTSLPSAPDGLSSSSVPTGGPVARRVFCRSRRGANATEKEADCCVIYETKNMV